MAVEWQRFHMPKRKETGNYMISFYEKLWLLLAAIMVFMSSSLSFGNEGGRVLIFVSFSMPDASIKGWMHEAEKVHAPLLIQGLIDNSFKKTIKKMAELSQDNHGGVQLDPTLFQKFHITQVPAVVVWDESENYDVVYGDVHLDYALEKIASENDGLSPIAQKVMTILRGKNHVQLPI